MLVQIGDKKNILNDVVYKNKQIIPHYHNIFSVRLSKGHNTYFNFIGSRGEFESFLWKNNIIILYYNSYKLVLSGSNIYISIILITNI